MTVLQVQDSRMTRKNFVSGINLDNLRSGICRRKDEALSRYGRGGSRFIEYATTLLDGFD